LPGITSPPDPSTNLPSEFKLETDVKASERFWELECTRFEAFRSHAADALGQRQDHQFDALTKELPEIKPPEELPARHLRDISMAARAGDIDETKAAEAQSNRANTAERERQKSQALAAWQARIVRLRACHQDARSELSRSWDRRLDQMRAEMNADVAPKSGTLARSRTGNRPRYS